MSPVESARHAPLCASSGWRCGQWRAFVSVTMSLSCERARSRRSMRPYAVAVGSSSVEEERPDALVGVAAAVVLVIVAIAVIAAVGGAAVVAWATNRGEPWQ